MPEIVPIERRIVLRDEEGLHIIIGLTSVQPPDVLSLNVPGATPINLVACKPRFWLYTPMMKPNTLNHDSMGAPKTFNPEQR